MGVTVAFSAVNYSSPLCGVVKRHLQYAYDLIEKTTLQSCKHLQVVLALGCVCVYIFVALSYLYLEN